MSTHTTDLSDRAVSYLRTVVPVAWGSLVALLLQLASAHLPADVVTALADWLGGPAAVALVTTVAIAAWYWAWRHLEPRVPDWLVRLVLGSAAQPTYAPVDADGTATITTLDERDVEALAALRQFLPEDDPSWVALGKLPAPADD